MKVNTYWLACAVLLYFCQVRQAEAKALVSKENPPCWEVVKANEARYGDNTPEDFVNPSCDEDGYFTPLQCFIKPLKCYCVDKYGNSKTKLIRVTLVIPDCRRLTQDTTMPPTTQVQTTTQELPVCLAASERTSHLKVFGWSGPSCDKDGYFSPLQCPFKTGCYCVDQYGEATTKVSRDISSVQDCKKFIQNTKQPTTEVQPTTAEFPPCWETVNDMKARFGGNFPQNFDGPNCDKDGYYAPLQCYPSTGCFCTDKYGAIKTGNFEDKSFIPDCSILIQVQPTTKALPPCWEAMKESTRFVNPSCDEDGYFTPLQCHEYMGCYCVDKYGNPRTQLSKNGRSFIRNCKNFAHPVTEDRK